jgi:hypothetical protein
MTATSHPPLSSLALADEKARWNGSSGSSAGNQSLGFRPAFRDLETGRVYLSAFADGRPAPVHMLDGLPQTLVIAYSPAGRVCTVKSSVVCGFVRDARFYTREEAQHAVEEDDLPPGPNPVPAAASMLAQSH